MSPQVVAAIIAGALTVIGTLAAQYFGRRATKRDIQEQGKQLDRTLEEQRTRTLNERFATAADRLGSDKPPAVQLAGVYAMAVLADDWEKNRQTCVDVLCAYLRMPYEPDPGAGAPAKEQRAFRASREVRHTVIRVIGAHLREGAAVSWQGLNFDFTGVAFDGGDFNSARFPRGTVSFRGAEFPRGRVDFSSAEFSGGTVDFSSAVFSGAEVSFYGAEFSGGNVSFEYAEFSGGNVSFSSAVFSGAEVGFEEAKFSGATVSFGAKFSGGAVSFGAADFSSGKVYFNSAEFSGGGVYFNGAVFSGAEASFGSAKFSSDKVTFENALFSGGMVDFGGAEFSGGTVEFDAVFSGAEVSFDNAEFSGGKLDFSFVWDWSRPPMFPWKGTPPPGVKLPEKKDQSQAQGSTD
jgi:uncharacterized protein YjbI with pentapeptide repeats